MKTRKSIVNERDGMTRPTIQKTAMGFPARLAAAVTKAARTAKVSPNIVLSDCCLTLISDRIDLYSSILMLTNNAVEWCDLLLIFFQ
jgi:hypothetical protein